MHCIHRSASMCIWSRLICHRSSCNVNNVSICKLFLVVRNFMTSFAINYCQRSLMYCSDFSLALLDFSMTWKMLCPISSHAKWILFRDIFKYITGTCEYYVPATWDLTVCCINIMYPQPKISQYAASILIMPWRAMRFSKLKILHKPYGIACLSLVYKYRCVLLTQGLHVCEAVT